MAVPMCAEHTVRIPYIFVVLLIQLFAPCPFFKTPLAWVCHFPFSLNLVLSFSPFLPPHPLFNEIQSLKYICRVFLSAVFEMRSSQRKIFINKESVNNKKRKENVVFPRKGQNLKCWYKDNASHFSSTMWSHRLPDDSDTNPLEPSRHKHGTRSKWGWRVTWS